MAHRTFGIIGGAGSLGRAILQAALNAELLPESAVWVSSRSGKLSGSDAQTDLRVTADNAELAAACDVVLLCVPLQRWLRISGSRSATSW